MSKNSALDFNISKFWNKIPANIAFASKFDSDASTMYNDFNYQYDSLYYCGARNISNNKGYSEEFEYFAPLYVQKNHFPTHFIIFRLDGPGLLKMTKENFRTQFLNKMKVVKVFDLTSSTDLGVFLQKNFINNAVYKDYPTEINFSETYSSINGIKYPVSASDGGYASKFFDLDFKKEYYFHELHKEITKKFEQSGIIFSNIINLSFLFDDTPATPLSLRKWSLNRYVGFYFDKLELVMTISPTELPSLKSDVSINRLNIIETQSGEPPFVSDNLNVEQLYVNVEGMIYKVKQIKEASTFKVQKVKTYSNSFEDIILRGQVVKYKIISENLLEGKTLYSDAPNFAIKIVYENGENKILNKDGTIFTIPNFDDSDLWLIKITDEYFRLIKNLSGNICLLTDYAFEQTMGELSWYINDPDPNYRKRIKTILSQNTDPVNFNIYRCKFTDIKDFDNDIVETNFAKFEYELDARLTRTEESKLYVTNLKTEAIDDFKFGSADTYIPASSEYTANNEIFRVNLDYAGNPYDITDLWRKNPTFVKWGYKGSLCNNDYPYLLNNSLLADPFNRSTNFVEAKPIRVEKNLDYFLSINSTGPSYTNHSLHVEDQVSGSINRNFKFELDKYLGINYNLDYFTYFFGKKNELFAGRIKKNNKKWSYINGGVDSTNNTVFRGLKFNIKKSNSVTPQSESVTNSDYISVSNTEDFTDYKFAILLSNNEYSVTPDPTNPNKALVTSRLNSLKWRVIEEFRNGKSYDVDDVVVWQDMLFVTTLKNTLEFPNNPGKSTLWQFYNKQNIFWNPNISNNFDFYGGFSNVVFNYGKYYYLVSDQNDIDFWNPKSSYNTNDIVIFKNSFLISKVDDNFELPSFSVNNYWEKLIEVGMEDSSTTFVQSTSSRFAGRVSKWKIVKEWNPITNYSGDTSFKVVTNDQILYGTTQSNFQTFGFDREQWIRLHSFNQDTNTIYGPTPTENNIVRFNQELYECVDNTVPLTSNVDIIDNTLNDGINIYINKKFKNILINIYVNDNTLSDVKIIQNLFVYGTDYVKNVNRDSLYDRLFYKFTASNLFSILNNPFNSYGFSDKLRYIIIEPDGDRKIYDFNNIVSAKKLPYVILSGEKTQVSIKKLKKLMSPYELGQNILNPTKKLIDGTVTTKSTINYYTDLPIAYFYSLNQPSELQSTIGRRSFPKIYRHGGQYSPIFKEIDLFRANTLTKNYDNYKFDTDLTEFGMTGEIVVSKVNRSGSLLKLKNSNTQKSIYPMVDEFGYHVVKRFIFKSNWDLEYHYECIIPDTTKRGNDERSLGTNGNI